MTLRPHASSRRLRAKAIDGRRRPGQLGDLRVAENALSMGAWKHTQGSVENGRIVEMNAQRDHALQGRGRRMCIEDSALDGPRSPARHILAFAQWERGVLMPDDQPVRLRRLVEQGGTEGPGRLSQRRIGDLEQSRQARERSDVWIARLASVQAIGTKPPSLDRRKAPGKCGSPRQSGALRWWALFASKSRNQPGGCDPACDGRSSNGTSRIGYSRHPLQLKCHHSLGSTVKPSASMTARRRSRRALSSAVPPA